jgi:endoglucanase
MRTDLLAELSNAHGTSGREAAIAAIVRRELGPDVDRIEADPLGGLCGIREAVPGTADPVRLMLAAHMDEIGLMVTAIEDSGFIRIIPLGGWDDRTLVSQRVVIHGRQAVPGVVGVPPVHQLSTDARGRAPKMADLLIDTGLPGERVRELVRPGDVVTRACAFAPLGDLLSGKALDDRVGVFVMLEAVRAAKRSPVHLLATATVQEEVGLRGARVAATRLCPDIGVAIDTCPSTDGPGHTTSGGTKLGGGAAIRIMDASAIGSHRLVAFLEQLAIDHDIPHQFHVSDKGGTDTQSLQLSGMGSIAGCVSIPTRYGHSSIEVCHPADVQAAIDLVVLLIEAAHSFAVGNLEPTPSSSTVATFGRTGPQPG